MFCQEEEEGPGENANNVKAMGTGPGLHDASGDEAQDAKIPTANSTNLLSLPTPSLGSCFVTRIVRAPCQRLSKLKTKAQSKDALAHFRLQLHLQSGSKRCPGLCEGPIIKLSPCVTINELGDNLPQNKQCRQLVS